MGLNDYKDRELVLIDYHSIISLHLMINRQTGATLDLQTMFTSILGFTHHVLLDIGSYILRASSHLKCTPSDQQTQKCKKW